MLQAPLSRGGTKNLLEVDYHLLLFSNMLQLILSVHTRKTDAEGLIIDQKRI